MALRHTALLHRLIPRTTSPRIVVTAPLPRPTFTSYPIITNNTTNRRQFANNMAPLPATMKAIEIAQNGGIEVLEHKDVPVPTLADNQVLIRNEFAGVNFIDTYFRSGLYKAPQFPLRLGREAAGEVIAATGAAAAKFPVGSKAVYMEGNAYAEYTAVNASNVISIPDGVSTEVAAAGYLQGLTAWTFIREAANVQPGQWAFVHAAAGGCGSLLVQMLHAIGAKVIASASTDEKLALAKKLGADYTVKSTDDVAAEVKKITNGHGVDAIFDGIGKSTFDLDLEMIARKGNLISFGNASGAVEGVALLRLAPKNVRLMRPVVNNYLVEREELEQYTTELFDMIKNKGIVVSIHDVYPLADAGRAHTDIESRKTTGKLVLKL
ncbi:hypothetical protein VHEMI05789 [[Torrubiella] hemipterigena]|uniref:Probable quinone oxidoreductase n=1 Tax=[Torrubiella] hemipterigena TaxID=1531966 RepID=A0A0A1THI1_9HYPO|nr:hypothetical protein VHEMI05789 [[Torrubiella] hemipterigena]